MELGTEDMITVFSGVITVTDGDVPYEITEVLSEITDCNTDICFRGCNTAPMAEAVDEILGGEPDVSGSPSIVFGVPWSTVIIGPWYTF